jgi:hypothetical protein
LVEGRFKRDDDRSAAVAWRRCILVVLVGGVGGTEESVNCASISASHFRLSPCELLVNTRSHVQMTRYDKCHFVLLALLNDCFELYS